jgi:Mitochondrial ribosomal protein L37
MILRRTCTQIRLTVRAFHASANASAAAKSQSAPNLTPATSIAAPFPPKSRPPDNDPLYRHPPSALQAGSAVRGVQILKDKPDAIALPDDYYPDWLWQLLDDPQPLEERAAEKREIEKKKEFYLTQRKEERIQKQLIESTKNRAPKLGQKRTLEEKKAVRRKAQNEAWLANREKEYEPMPQFEMPPERNAKYHKRVNKENIKKENYLRGRGM